MGRPAKLEPEGFETAGSPVLRGEGIGEGPPVVLCHGLTATRRYVLHGSRMLPRKGYEVITYDARGHGHSEPGEAYGYEQLIADLARVVEQRVGRERPFVLGGHSMGAHTAVGYALANPGRVAALVVAGPVYAGEEGEPEMTSWDRLADALESGGPEAFGRAAARDIEGPIAETVERLARERIQLHDHPDAVLRALREVPRSRPFGSLEQLAGLEMPALVVASHDQADPGHPYEVARLYAERMRNATLISERQGESPLAWQGGKLSREISSFLERSARV